MIILGHRYLPTDSFYHVGDIESISNTPPSSVIFIQYSKENLDIINHAHQNAVSFALSANNITEIVFASAFGASFIVVKKELAKTAQNIANNYLFDAKILVNIEDDDEIEELAVLGVDGVIFSNAIVKINS